MDAAKRQTILINAAHSFTHYSLLILATAVLAMVQQDSGIFGGDYGPILALGTAMFVIYGICALPMGWLADRFGRRFLMIAFFMGSGAFMVAAGFAPSPLMLAITLGAMGAFVAIYHPIGTAILVEAAGPKVGRAMGINGVFGNLGVATAPVLTAFIAADAGWRWAFMVFAFLDTLDVEGSYEPQYGDGVTGEHQPYVVSLSSTFGGAGVATSW